MVWTGDVRIIIGSISNRPIDPIMDPSRVRFGPSLWSSLHVSGGLEVKGGRKTKK